MKFLTRWFLDNPVAANLLMAFIVVAGYFSLQQLRVESFPQIAPNSATISVAYPGGTAEQVDQSITQPIESAIQSVAGIKTMTSQSMAGFANITVVKNSGVKLDRLVENLRNQVESISGFPAQAERPKITRNEFGNLASFILVYGGDNDQQLHRVSKQVQIALKKHPAISQVSHLGQRKNIIRIEPDHQKLQQHGLDASTLADAIRAHSLQYKTGELLTGQGPLILKGADYVHDLLALGQINVMKSAQGQVKLNEVAAIKREFSDADAVVRFQGKPAVALMLSTGPKDHLLKVSKATESVIEDIMPTLPPGFQVEVMADMAPYIEDQLQRLSKNAWQGLIIVLIVLGLFLELRLAFWVAIGIPISLAGASWLMGLPWLNYSINDITLFGMILVLGILVDDAVVVGESIYQAREEGLQGKAAAAKGVESVAVATTYGVLTTIAAFSPMLWIDNELAKVLAGFSAVVIFALIFSLVESKFILPSHLAGAPLKEKFILLRGIKWLRVHCQQGLTWFAQNVYGPVLSSALRNRLLSLVFFACFGALAYGGMAVGKINAVFFPEIPGRYASVKIEMQPDAPRALAQLNLLKLEQAGLASSKQLQQKYSLAQPAFGKTIVFDDGAQELSLTAELTTEALEVIPSTEILATLKHQLGNLEGSYSTRFTQAEEPAGGTGISVSGQDRHQVQQVVSQLKLALAQQVGVVDVFDTNQNGRRQLQVTLNQRGEQLGLSQSQLAQFVGGTFGSIEVYRLLDAGEETQVLIQLPKQAKQSVQQLAASSVHLGEGRYVALGEIADFNYRSVPEIVERRNRNQVVTVFWRQDRTLSSPEKVWRSLQSNEVAALENLYPGIKVRAVGEFDEIASVQSGFKQALLLTLLLIYVLLAVPLKSYWQPLIIMSVIPFGFAGAVIGHGLLGMSVSVLSLFGMMAMTGVVINDSLVLMTKYNQLIEQGVARSQALLEAGRSRMRAIFLTTITTVCGLLPLLSETSEQAQYLKPAAISLVFGELFATPITLILIPILLSLGKQREQKTNLTPAPGHIDSIPS